MGGVSIRVEPGDCLAVMKRLKDEGVMVHAIVTDPPYHLTSIVKRFGGKGAAPAQHGTDGAFARASRGFMGKQWDGGDVAFQTATWRLAWELLPPGGHLVAFSGTRTYHRMAVAIEDAGFEIRDNIVNLLASDGPVRAFLSSLSMEQQSAFFKCIDESEFGGLLSWVYGSGFPKSHDVSKAIDKAAGVEREVLGQSPNWRESKRDREKFGSMEVRGENAGFLTEPVTAAAKQWQGWGTALKPAWEPIVLARKPLDGTVAANVQEHGTGAINIDGCRVGTESTVRNSNPGTNGEGWGMGKSAHINGSVAGRFPANIVHDGSDEVLAAFPDAPGQQQPSRDDQRSQGSVYGAISLNGTREHTPRGDSGSAARFFYSAKADAEDRVGSKHPTVKPVDLMAWLVRMVTPPGGTVLDPFAGTGTTGIAALREGFNAILIEREEEYLGDIAARIALATGSAANHSMAVKGRHRDKEEAGGKGTPLFGGRE